MLLRLSGGEPLLHLPAFVHYPMYEDGQQYFPFKTMATLISLSCCIGGSLGSEWLFKSGILQPELDFLNCVVSWDLLK
jgi:high affinity choline transporter 7